MIGAHQSTGSLILATTNAIFFLLCCGLFALLYKLEKLHHGDEIRLIHHLVIVCRILVTTLALSQLWLNDSTRYTIIPFLGGVVVLFYCLRVPFREARKQDLGLYVSILLSLLFSSTACLALIYSYSYRIDGERDISRFFLRRFSLYGGCASVSLLVALRFYCVRPDTAISTDRPPLHLLPTTDLSAMV